MSSSTRQKMYQSNSKIKKLLTTLNFKHLFSFPHLRFQKDYTFEGEGFDAFGWREGDKNIYFFQFKTNQRPLKKVLISYSSIESKYNCKCLWITTIKRKDIEIYASMKENEKTTLKSALLKELSAFKAQS